MPNIHFKKWWKGSNRANPQILKKVFAWMNILIIMKKYNETILTCQTSSSKSNEKDQILQIRKCFFSSLLKPNNFSGHGASPDSMYLEFESHLRTLRGQVPVTRQVTFRERERISWERERLFLSEESERVSWDRETRERDRERERL